MQNSAKFYIFLFILLFSFGCVKKNPSNKNFYMDKSYPALGQEPINFSHFKNKKYTIINYWATWCPPCHKEVAELNNIQEKFSKDLTVVGITLESLSPDILEKAIVTMGIKYPIITTDIIKIMYDLSVEVYPTTYIIDASGQVKAVFQGPVTAQEIEKQLPEINGND